jgi:hypothetical protein
MPTSISGAAGGILCDQQTWQNLTSSRSLETAYQNSTGRPIVVSVVAQGAFNDNYAILTSPTAGGTYVTIAQADCGDYFSPSGNVPHNTNLQGIIPAGWYYKAAFVAGGLGPLTLIYWAELR